MTGSKGDPAVRVYVGLGANVGDARVTLRDAVASLAGLPGAEVRGVSSLYRTKPVGVVDQPDFLNAVVALELAPDPAGVEAGALRFLVQLKQIERDFGRRRRRRWGPRELDLDLLLYGGAELALERPPEGVGLSAAVDASAATRLLEVPHPSMADRLFVLVPLAEVAPELVPPGWTESVSVRANRLAHEPGATDAVRAAGRWHSGQQDWR